MALEAGKKAVSLYLFLFQDVTLLQSKIRFKDNTSITLAVIAAVKRSIHRVGALKRTIVSPTDKKVSAMIASGTFAENTMVKIQVGQ